MRPTRTRKRRDAFQRSNRKEITPNWENRSPRFRARAGQAGQYREYHLPSPQDSWPRGRRSLEHPEPGPV